MIRHLFLDKTNTILENSYQNLGLNPILSVGYGKFLMRGLIHFDLNDIKEKIEDKTFADVSKLKFKLKMVNCFSVDSVPYEKPISMSPDFEFERASSFDLMLFKLPISFDAGRGFDYSDDFFIKNRISMSDKASNWYFAKTCIPWPYEKDKFDLDDQTLNFKKVRYYDREKAAKLSKDVLTIAENYTYSGSEYEINTLIDDLRELVTNNSTNENALNGGVYDKEFIEEEYEKYLNGEESIVVSTQHFDFGSENLCMDITNYVLNELDSVINPGEEPQCILNYGLCLAFTPYYENIGHDAEEYVGFFTDHTNTFFHPYIEVEYNEYVDDDRERFTIGTENKLYLYCFDDGEPINLDELPVCTIDGNTYEVKQSTKGVYYAVINDFNDNSKHGLIYEDIWSNIKYKQSNEEDVVMEFSTRPKSTKIMFGDKSYDKNKVVPSLSGINDDEKVKRDEERQVIVDFREKFSTDKRYLISNAEWRLYVYDGNRQFDVIPYQKVEKNFLNNYFIIYTQDLIPNKYYIDIKVNDGLEKRVFEKVLSFDIVSNVTERYE